MGRKYAGILGLIAFSAAALRGLVHHNSVDSTMATACLALLAFAAAGFVLGGLADWIVIDSVQMTVAAELASLEETTAVEKE